MSGGRFPNSQHFVLIWCNKEHEKLVEFPVCFVCHSVAEGSSQGTQLDSWKTDFFSLSTTPVHLTAGAQLEMKEGRDLRSLELSGNMFPFSGNTVPVTCALVAREANSRHAVHKEADQDMTPRTFLLFISRVFSVQIHSSCCILRKWGFVLGYILGNLCLIANMKNMERLFLISVMVYQNIIYVHYTAIIYLINIPCSLFRSPVWCKRVRVLAQVCHFYSFSFFPDQCHKGILHTCCCNSFTDNSTEFALVCLKA